MPLLWAYRRGVRRCSAIALAAMLGLTMVSCSTSSHKPSGPAPQQGTATPIHHLVVVFQENVSFDHYFGTYPNAANVDGQRFTAGRGHRLSMV
jgi:phospholipase C